MTYRKNKDDLAQYYDIFIGSRYIPPGMFHPVNLVPVNFTSGKLRLSQFLSGTF